MRNKKWGVALADVYFSNNDGWESMLKRKIESGYSFPILAGVVCGQRLIKAV